MQALAHSLMYILAQALVQALVQAQLFVVKIVPSSRHQSSVQMAVMHHLFFPVFFRVQ
jgi:hypothetical protein